MQDENSDGCSAAIIFGLAWLALVIMLIKHWVG